MNQWYSPAAILFRLFLWLAYSPYKHTQYTQHVDNQEWEHKLFCNTLTFIFEKDYVQSSFPSLLFFFYIFYFIICSLSIRQFRFMIHINFFEVTFETNDTFLHILMIRDGGSTSPNQCFFNMIHHSPVSKQQFTFAFVEFLSTSTAAMMRNYFDWSCRSACYSPIDTAPWFVLNRWLFIASSCPFSKSAISAFRFNRALVSQFSSADLVNFWKLFVMLDVDEYFEKIHFQFSARLWRKWDFHYSPCPSDFVCEMNFNYCRGFSQRLYLLVLFQFQA